MSTQTRLAALLAVLTPGLLLGGAYIAQYGFGLYPCEMCWWQRYALFVALALGVLAWLFRLARPIIWLAALAIATSSAIGAYHAGVEYGWWQGVTACTAIAAASDGNALEAILNAPVVRCDQAPWALFGVSLAGWNFLFSGAAALAMALLLTRKPGGSS